LVDLQAATGRGGVHPAEKGGGSDFSFMCDDLEATLAELTAKGVTALSPPSKRDWGIATWIRLPGGAEVGLYQPFHKTAYDR
jgi:predicted enzyme related to lactoylglutathione lyase